MAGNGGIQMQQDYGGYGSPYAQGGGYGANPYGQPPASYGQAAPYGPPPASSQYGQPYGQSRGYGQNPEGGSPQSDPMASGFHGDPYATGASSASGWQPQNPMSSGVAGAYPDLDYRQYTETGKGSAASSGEKKQAKIDPETGIAPRRCTDLVCVVLFGLYFSCLLIMLCVVKTKTVDGQAYSDIRRLSHGFDYQARLCGVDDGVQDKPYLFWCRKDASPRIPFAQTPPGNGAGINLYHPVCVSQCPSLVKSGNNQTQLGPRQVECLLQEQGTGGHGEVTPVSGIKGNQFGNRVNYFLMFWQQTAYTVPYDTELLSGRYCVPTDSVLKAEVMSGPLSPLERVHKSIGSFEDCWGVMSIALVVSIVLSYLYVYIIGNFKNSAKYIVTASLLGVWALSLISGLFFSFAAAMYCKNIPGLENLNYGAYMDKNTFYERNSERDATIISIVVGLALLFLSCFPFGIVMNLKHEFEHIHELIHAGWEAVSAMPTLLIVPAVEAVVKYFVMWIMAYNFMHVVAAGTYDDYRIIVEEQLWQGLSKTFAFDRSMLFWIGFYLFGWIWAVEIVTSFGQFIVSSCGILFHFTKKVNGVKQLPKRPPVDAFMNALRYNLGSIFLGASGIWLFRLPRIFLWFESESIPTGKSECCGPCSCLSSIVKSVGGCCDQYRGNEKQRAARKAARTFSCCCISFTIPSIIYQWNKNGYQDVVIRCQHFLQAMDTAERYIMAFSSINMYTGKCALVTIVGVLWIGFAGSFLSYLIMDNASYYNDPTRDTYIQDPAAVALLAFLMCSSIAYGFCTLIDHMADTLLYCYSFNRKFNKGTVGQFVPTLIQDIAGHDGLFERPYGYFGRARPEMYLGTWMEGLTNLDRPGFNKQKQQAQAQAAMAQLQSPPSSPGSPSPK
jgi:hypothetical protein